MKNGGVQSDNKTDQNQSVTNHLRPELTHVKKTLLYKMQQKKASAASATVA